MAYLYILQSLKNDRYYIGSTSNLDRRLIEHKSGQSTYTKHVLPVELVFHQKFPDLQAATRAEYWLKKQKDKDLIRNIITDGKLNKSF